MQPLKALLTAVVALAGLALQPALAQQQFSYSVGGPTSVPVGTVLDVSISISLSVLSESPIIQGVVPAQGFAVEGSPESVSSRAFCVTGSIVYQAFGNEPLNTPIEICRYRFRANAATAGAVNLLAEMTGPAVQAISSAAAPSVTYNPAAGSIIPYPAGGAGPSIAVANGGSGAGSGSAATTTVTGCVISDGGAAFPVTQFNPAIAVVGTAAPTPAGIVLPACAPQTSATQAQLRCSETRGSAAPVHRSWTLGCPAAGGGTSQVATPPDIESEALGGGFADAASSQPTLSANGLKLAFASSAGNLVAGDGNGREDIFLRDRTSGATTRVSAVAEGLIPGFVESFTEPAIARDGNRVAFTGSSGQVYAAVDGAGRVLSRSANGAIGNGRSGRAFLPGAGSLAFFESEATNLLTGADGNGAVKDIFMTDLATGAVTLISRAPNGAAADGPSSFPRASEDGLAVVFSTRATNLATETAVVPKGSKAGDFEQVLYYIRGGSIAIYASRNRSNGQLGNGDSIRASLTPDRRFGVFESVATNLVAGDTNNLSDIFRFEVANDRIINLQRVSVSRTGTQGNGASRRPAISDDGQCVAFETDASNLLDADANARTDVVAKSLATGEVIRISRSPQGEPNGASSQATISGNCSTFGFASEADNVVAGDNNNAQDNFSTQLVGAGAQDEPRLTQFVLPTPNPPNLNCPSGFFSSVVDDGPGAGVTAGAFGVEVLLDEPGTRVLAGGINFGGLMDVGQVGFAAFNIANPANESQRLNLNLTGSPSSSSTASIPVRIRIARRTATTSDTVFESTQTISLANPYVTSVDLPPAFYEATVAPTSGSAAGTPEGQFFFSLTTSFINRPGGGFQGGAVVGGYHAAHPFGGVSGFAAFCLATPHTTTIRVLSRPSYGPAGARDLRLRIQDAQQRDVVVVPGG